MDALFLGLGDLGWKTMHSAIAAAIAVEQRSTFGAYEMPVTAKILPIKHPSFARKIVDYSFRRRGAKLAEVLRDFESVRHVHCYGHFVAEPSVLKDHGASYSVTLDSTQAVNLAEFAEGRGSRGRRANRHRAAAEEQLLVRADFICCTSDWARQGVLRYPVNPERVHLNPFPTFGSSRIRDPDSEWLTFVGNDIARKGGDRVVAWHQENFRDDVELHMVSNDPVAAGYARLRNVIVHGGLPNAIIRHEILPMTRLLVLPTWYDQSPITLTEAAAAGVPVVASAVAGIPELVVDGVSGFLVAPDDDQEFVARIRKILSDTGLTRAMGLEARAHYCRNLRTEDSIERLMSLVDQALAR